jgi:hypothetical protein
MEETWHLVRETSKELQAHRCFCYLHFHIFWITASKVGNRWRNCGVGLGYRLWTGTEVTSIRTYELVLLLIVPPVLKSRATSFPSWWRILQKPSGPRCVIDLAQTAEPEWLTFSSERAIFLRSPHSPYQPHRIPRFRLTLNNIVTTISSTKENKVN